MSAVALLDNLTMAGAVLWVEGDKLRFRAPAGAITDELRADMVTHKAELIEALRPPPPSEPAPAICEPPEEPPTSEYDPPVPCPRCDGMTFWWSITGEQHCAGCEPPMKSVELLKRAQRIRRGLGLPENKRAEQLLIDLQAILPHG